MRLVYWFGRVSMAVLCVFTATSAVWADDGKANAKSELAGSTVFHWKNSLIGEPPAMRNPIIIRGVDGLNAYKSNVEPPNQVYPKGDVYWTSAAPKIAADADLIIDLRGEVITEPIKVWNARHVWVVGGSLIPNADAGGEVGQLANYNEAGGLIENANIYPRIYGGNVLQIACSGTLRIEGCLIDCGGMNIDAIVANSNPSQTAEDARANKRFEILNCIISGYRGHLANYANYGDGLHADCFQMQDEQSSYNTLLIENCLVRSGQEGVVANCIGSHRPSHFEARNVTFTIDDRYIDPNPMHRQYPLFLSANTETFRFDNIWLPRPQGWSVESNSNFVNSFGYSNWWKSTLTYYTAPSLAEGVLSAAPGLHLYGGTIAENNIGSPPEAAFFVTEANTGANYDSPWKVPQLENGKK